MSDELLNALTMVADERRMELEDLIATIEEAVTLAAIKRLERTNLEALFTKEKGEFTLWEILTVVEDVTHPATEINLTDAKAIDEEAEPEGEVRRPVVMEGLGRIAARSVRQMIHKKGREAQTASLREQYRARVGEMISAKISRKSREGFVFDLGDAEGLLSPEKELAHDRPERGARMKIAIDGVSEERGMPLVTVSRTDPSLLEKLIELETPEIAEDLVTIVAIARDRSGASKVAVSSRKKDIDPVGAIIGARGSRIQPVSKELAGEKIDVFHWSDDLSTLITSALTPAKKMRVILNEKERKADVIVADDQLSLAIGRKGVNVNLAAKIADCSLDVMNEEEFVAKEKRLAKMKKEWRSDRKSGAVERGKEEEGKE